MFGKKFLFLKIYELKSTRKIKNVDVNRKIGKLKLFIGNLKTNTVHKSRDLQCIFNLHTWIGHPIFNLHTWIGHPISNLH